MLSMKVTAPASSSSAAAGSAADDRRRLGRRTGRRDSAAPTCGAPGVPPDWIARLDLAAAAAPGIGGYRGRYRPGTENVT